MALKSIALKVRGFLLMATCMTITGLSVAQKVDVDLLTGTSSFNIPIVNIENGDIRLPISLYYQASGIKVNDTAQSYGLGWKLAAEASVTRTVKGYPDDKAYQGDATYPVIYGWLKTTDIPGKVENFTIANDNNTTTCNDEFIDYTYIHNNFWNNFDTEPDIFSVSVPGFNFSFVFDKNKQIRVIPYKDVQVTYTTNSQEAITSFTVVNDKGIKYVFDKAVYANYQIDEVLDPATLDAFKRNYYFYRHSDAVPGMQYNYKWYLSTITDSRGNQVIYNYNDAISTVSAPNFTEKVELVKYNSSAASWNTQYLYTTKGRFHDEQLIGISVRAEDVIEQHVKFEWEHDGSRLKNIKLLRDGKVVHLGYTKKFSRQSEYAGRFFLQGIYQGTGICGNESVYTFSYYDVDEAANTCYCTAFDSLTNAQDYWGYYNGAGANANLVPPVWVYPDNPNVDKFKIAPIPGYTGNVVLLPGANRNSNISAIGGTLHRITFPNGAVTQFDYENKDYYDKDINGAVTGGGIRIKKITANDGLNTNEVTYYDYNDPATGITSGRAIALPSFTLAFFNNNSYPNISDKVNNSTYRTVNDFSEEAKGIIYKNVTVRRTGAGKSVYEFNTASTWGSTATGDWSETLVYYSRPFFSNPSNCTPVSPDFLSNGIHSYPFPANPNYDFDRGRLKKISQYRETGELIMEQDYTYERSHSQPVIINALKTDEVGGIRAYAKYNILSTVDNLVKTKVAKKWNLATPTPGVFTTETETYSYESTDHRLLTKVELQNSDGTLLRTRYKYVKDYGTTGAGDQYEQAIHSMKQNNDNILTESWQSVVSGGIEKVIEASLTTYNTIAGIYHTPYLHLPVESWKFMSKEGVTNFTPSYFNGGILTKYNAFFKNFTVLKYNGAGQVMTVVNNSKTKKTTVYDAARNLKVAEFVNAGQDEVIYSAFDYGDGLVAINMGANTYALPGHSSSACLNLQAGTPVTKEISNAATNRNIIVSCWLKDAAAAGNLTVTIQLTATNFTNYTIPYTVHGNWKYYEIAIPKPAYPSITAFTVILQSSSAIKIDDIIAIPDNADIKTYSFTQKEFSLSQGTEIKGYLLTAEGGNNGTLQQFEYDEMGRVSVVRDEEDNIREVKSYKRANHWPTFSSSTLTWTTPANINTPITFSNGPIISPCLINGAYYKWNFGDGTPEVTTAANSASHTYTANGKYVVTCTAYPPGSTPVTVSTPPVSDANAVTIITPPPPLSIGICAAGIVERTASGQCILAHCTGLTSVCTNTNFKVSSVSGSNMSDLEVIIWEKAPLGSNTWTVVPGLTPTITFTSQSYKVRCRVGTIYDQSATSAELVILNNQ